LVRIIERGFLFRYQKVSKRVLNWDCMSDDLELDHGMGLRDVFTAFAILAFGKVSSFTFLLWEILIFRNQRMSFQFME